MIAVLWAIGGVACWSADLVFCAGVCTGAAIVLAVLER